MLERTQKPPHQNKPKSLMQNISLARSEARSNRPQVEGSAGAHNFRVTETLTKPSREARRN